MNEITMNNVILPTVSSCDYLAAQESFFHADRIADFHVMIYVTDGCIPVTEDDIDYEIHTGDLFFLKMPIGQTLAGLSPRPTPCKQLSLHTAFHGISLYC